MDTFTLQGPLIFASAVSNRRVLITGNMFFDSVIWVRPGNDSFNQMKEYPAFQCKIDQSLCLPSRGFKRKPSRKLIPLGTRSRLRKGLRRLISLGRRSRLKKKRLRRFIPLRRRRSRLRKRLRRLKRRRKRKRRRRRTTKWNQNRQSQFLYLFF